MENVLSKSSTRDITLFLVGDTEQEARDGLLFDDYEAADDYAAAEGKRFVFAVTGTVDLSTLVEERDNVHERLELLRAALRAESISMDELIELQGLAELIEPGDVELLEAAGVPEFPADGQHRMDAAPRSGDTDEPTYRIVRFYQSDDYDTETIQTGLTLDEAQAWCNDPETSSSTCQSPVGKERTAARGPWFDGYTEESPVIGPRWFQRLAYRERWEHLDRLMDSEIKAVRLVELWRDRAQHVTGEELWHANFLAALSEQVVADTKDTWLAVYGGRWSDALLHGERMHRHSEELGAASRELLALVSA